MTTDTKPDTSPTPGGEATPSTADALLISLPSLQPDRFEAMLVNIAEAFPSRNVLVMTPDADAVHSANKTTLQLQLYSYTPAAPSTTPWVLNASDYLNSFKQMQEHGAIACLMLGAESQSLRPETLRALADGVLKGGIDLTVPRYDLGPRDGLVNSAILYPVTRALYGVRPRFPLAIDLGLSRRMAERLATAAQRFTAVSQNDALLWPIAEACVANYAITEIDAGTRQLPPPTPSDLNSILALVTGSLFADVDAKASHWQRSRASQPPRILSYGQPLADPMPDVTPMLEAFNLAHTNLNEIWSLVLPPNSQLALKRLAQMPPASFRMGESLWARIVYDFILAYRLRTINRGHLLGALTPLYLAWVASHFIICAGGVAPERHIEDQAAAFEADKPYLVSRWRWPDRFNP